MNENVLKTYVAQKALIWSASRTKFLMLLRGKTAPTGPLTWDFPGGDVERGENLEEGILREIKEETGITVTNINQDFSYLNDPDGTGDMWLTIFYEAQAESENIVISWEHDEYRWFTYEEVIGLPLKIKIKAYLDQKFI